MYEHLIISDTHLCASVLFDMCFYIADRGVKEVLHIELRNVIKMTKKKKKMMMMRSRRRSRRRRRRRRGSEDLR